MRLAIIFALTCLAAVAISGATADLGFSQVDVLVYRHEAELTLLTYNSNGTINSTTPFPDFIIGTQKVRAAVSAAVAAIYLVFVDHTPQGPSVQVLYCLLSAICCNSHGQRSCSVWSFPRFAKIALSRDLISSILTPQLLPFDLDYLFSCLSSEISRGSLASNFPFFFLCCCKTSSAADAGLLFALQVAAISYLNKRVLYPLTSVNISGFDDVVGIAHDTLSGATVLSAYNGTSRINCFLQISMHSGHVWQRWCLPPYIDQNFAGYPVFTANNIIDQISYGTPDPVAGLPYCMSLCSVNLTGGAGEPCNFLMPMSTGTFINLLPMYDSPDVFIIAQNVKMPNVTSIWKTNPLNVVAPVVKIADFPASTGNLPASAVAFYSPWREVIVSLWAEPQGLRLVAFDGSGAGLKMDRSLDPITEGFEAIAVGVRLIDVAPAPVAPAPVLPPVAVPFAVYNPAGQINTGGGVGTTVGIIIAVVIVLIAVAGFFLWRFYRTNGAGSNKTGWEDL